jgi:hypothetical protein
MVSRQRFCEVILRWQAANPGAESFLSNARPKLTISKAALAFEPRMVKNSG